jgi:hypothetical protein
MKWPPYLLKIRVRNRRHAFVLWLPLFLIWPLVLVFLTAMFLILLPFALLAMLFTWETGYWRPVLLSVPLVIRLICSLPGTKVDVDGQAGRVSIAFS